MKITKYILAIFFIFHINPVYSCSRPPLTPTVEEAFNDAANVYLAFAESTVIKEGAPWPGTNIKPYKLDVNFVVLETWKGNRKIRENIKYTYTMSNGGCNVSPANNPPWFEAEPSKDSDPDKINYAQMSGVWLIYEAADGDRELQRNGRTAPLEYGGANDLQALYVLSGKLRK